MAAPARRSPRWLAPVLGASGFLVPIPVGVLLAGTAGATVAIVAAFAVAAVLFGAAFALTARQERRERGDRPPGPRTSGNPELDARLAEIREREGRD